MVPFPSPTETRRMTTLRDRPEPHGSAGAAGDTASPNHGNAHCPHCGELMEAGVQLPWPPEPALCQSCSRWVGRARAIAGEVPTDAAGEVEGNGAEPVPEESAPAGDDARTARPGRHARHSSARPGQRQRRRARELGPPPVPRFASGDRDAEDPEGHAHHPDGHAHPEGLPAGDEHGWEAPAGADHLAGPQAHEGDGGSEAEAAHAGFEPHPDPDAGHETGVFVDSSGGEEPTHIEHYPAEDDADGSFVEEAAPESPPAAPHAPGNTLPYFWAVEAEPQKRRRLRLPRLGRPTLRRPRLRRPTKAGALRALPIVLLVIGGLLLAEVAVTVLWKEPFSAIFAASSQSALGDELEKLEREAAAEAAQSRKQMVAYQRRRAVSLNRQVGVGEAVGRLRIKELGLNEVVVQGTDDVTIQKGPGHYVETPLPGQKGDWTVGIAGHRTTYGAPFRRINELKRGDEIVFTVPYGRFTYNVDDTKIVDAGYTEAMVPKGKDMIVLTACHPLYSAAQRILVYGKLTKSEPRGGAARAAQ
jgi:sortase A